MNILFLLICNEAKFISKGSIPQPSLHLKETTKKIMNMDVNKPRVAKGKGIEVKYHKEMLPIWVTCDYGVIHHQRLKEEVYYIE